MLDFDNRELFDEDGSLLTYHKNTKINATGAQVIMLIGKRSCGKTYSTLTFDCIKRFIDSGYKEKFAYVRRSETEMMLIKNDIFSGMIKNGWLEWYTKGKWNDISYWQGKWYLRRINDEGEVEEKLKTPMAYAFCVSTSMKAKGPDYIDIFTIVFDEFIPLNGVYCAHEVQQWQNLISTIDRARNRVKVYMLANTISTECPHFEHYRVDPDKLVQGRIHIFKVGTKGTLAVEYCNDVGSLEATESVYFNLDDEVGSMILTGAWQRRKFQKLPDDIDVEKLCTFKVYILHREKLIDVYFLATDVPTIYFAKSRQEQIDIDDLIYVDDQYIDSAAFKNVRVKFSQNDTIARCILRKLSEGRCYFESDEIGEKVAYFASL